MDKHVPVSQKEKSKRIDCERSGCVIREGCRLGCSDFDFFSHFEV